MLASLQTSLQKPALHLALLLILAMALSSCGRRGDLQAPGSVQADGTPVEQPASEEVTEEKEDKPFILDGIL